MVGRSDLDEVLAAARTGDFGGLDVLVAALRSPDQDVRLRAAYFCDRIGPADAVPVLCTLARDDSSPAVRNQALAALAATGLVGAVPALIDVLGDDDPELREDAEAALYVLIGDEVPALLRRAHDNDEPDAGQQDRLRAWWTERAPDFDPGTVYRAGLPAGPTALVDQLEDLAAVPQDSVTAALLDWTGVEFPGSRVSVNRRWRAWLREYGDAYVPGRRYFAGHRVPVRATPQ